METNPYKLSRRDVLKLAGAVAAVEITPDAQAIGVLSVWVSISLADTVFAAVIAALAVIAFAVAMRFPEPNTAVVI
jgi:preprotein translocase subunit SecF